MLLGCEIVVVFVVFVFVGCGGDVVVELGNVIDFFGCC